MNPSLKRLTQSFDSKAKAASPQELERLKSVAGIKLPDDYAELMAEMNGCSGWLGDPDEVEDEHEESELHAAYVRFFELNQVLQDFETRHSRKFFPGFLSIGSNGGGESIAVRNVGDVVEVGCLPMIGSPSDFIPVGGSVTAFLQEVEARALSGRSVLNGKSQSNTPR
jgi:hypothetical protein